MSGGVDSTMAAHALLAGGHPPSNVVGVFMRNWDELDETGQCTAKDEYRRVQQVCARLGIACYELDFVKEYWNSVFSKFLTGYQQGLTPNPDVLCNQYIKFGSFLNTVSARFQVDFVATGHYAQRGTVPAASVCSTSSSELSETTGTVLVRGNDPGKDQTYFLAGMPAATLNRVIFPIGSMRKSDVKRAARQAGFTGLADQKESMGICFIGKRKFREFLRQYVDDVPGGSVVMYEDSNLQGTAPKVVGHHNGTHLFTIGQRASVAGLADRCFVVGKDVAKNVLYVVKGNGSPALLVNEFVAVNMRWTAGSPPPPHTAVTIQTRHRQEPMHCDFVIGPTGSAMNDRCSDLVGNFPGVDFSPCVALCDDTEALFQLKAPARAVAPGQEVVVYALGGTVCLGGGKIKSTRPPPGCGLPQ